MVSEDFAELYGALLGDGCLSFWKRKNRHSPSYATVITGHIHERNYYDQTLVPLFQQEFGITPIVRKRNNMNAIVLTTYNTSVFNCFKSYGFPVGVKSSLRIPPEIYADTYLSLSCIRGIFDTDGSVYERYTKKYSYHARKYSYSVVQVKMKQPYLLFQIKSILSSVGIRCTRITKDGSCSVLRITHQESIYWFFQLVSPSNQYHVNRYKTGSGGI